VIARRLLGGLLGRLSGVVRKILIVKPLRLIVKGEMTAKG